MVLDAVGALDGTLHRHGVVQLSPRLQRIARHDVPLDSVDERRRSSLPPPNHLTTTIAENFPNINHLKGAEQRRRRWAAANYD